MAAAKVAEAFAKAPIKAFEPALVNVSVAAVTFADWLIAAPKVADASAPLPLAVAAAPIPNWPLTPLAKVRLAVVPLAVWLTPTLSEALADAAPTAVAFATAVSVRSPLLVIALLTVAPLPL